MPKITTAPKVSLSRKPDAVELVQFLEPMMQNDKSKLKNLSMFPESMLQTQGPPVDLNPSYLMVKSQIRYFNVKTNHP